MKILVWMLVWLVPFVSFAAPSKGVTLNAAQYKRIVRALHKCKGLKKKHKVDLQAASLDCQRRREVDAVLCKAGRPPNVWPYVVVGVLGVAVGVGVGVMVGLASR